MKSILISIKPEWVAKILNGEKTIEIRKNAPKEFYYRGYPTTNPELITAYVYCTKDGYLHLENDGTWSYTRRQKYTYKRVGKVVAKFTIKEMEKYEVWDNSNLIKTNTDQLEILKESCLSGKELSEYLGGTNGKVFYAWHISDLVIFDEPKELDQFEYLNSSGTRNVGQRELNGKKNKKHPPQSWCYVEVRE